MQANEFEREIKSKMEAFSLVPKDEVWQHVSARIETEKKRRRLVFYWVFTGFLFLSGLIGWWLTGKEKDDSKAYISKLETPKTAQKSNVTAVKPTEAKELSNKIKKDNNKALEDLLSANVEADKREAKKNYLQITVSNKANLLNKITAQQDLIENTIEEGNAIKLLRKQQSDKTSADKVTEILPGNSDANNLQAEQPNLLNPDFNAARELVKGTFIQQKDTTVIADSSQKDTTAIATSVQKKFPKIKKQKKLNFGFTVYAGLSDNLSGFPLATDKSLSSDYLYIPGNSSSGGGQSSNGISALTYSAGSSFGIGGYAILQLGRRTALSLGVDYHHYKTASSVGGQSNSRQSFFDSVLSQFVSVDQSNYTTGKSVQFSNSYHFIELPIHLSLRINKNQNKPLLVSAGITPGYLAASNALYANRSMRIYYTEKKQFNHFQLSGQTGFSYPFVNTKKYSFSAGPVLQFGFLNMSKQQTGLSQHLFFTGLKANISLK